jgi:glycosyltransferase involved in cell wall biosynthesis
VLPDLDADAWAQAITELVDNTQKRTDLGEMARVRAEEFTWRNVAEQRASLLENRFPELWNKNR